VSSGAGWQDPFAEDEAARERARRRAERERRRRERQAALATKVREEPPRAGEHPEPGPPPEPPPPLPGEPPAGPGGARRTTYARRRFAAATGLLALLAVTGLGIAAAIRHFDRPPPPPPPPKPKTETVTIAEGHTRAEVSALVRDAGLRGNYLRASRSFKGFNPARYGAPAGATLEGFLFPATYELPAHPTVRDLIERQLQAFKQNFAKVDLSYARSKNLTPYDVLIIASMIEREAAVPSDRPKVAAVIYNRLHAGMPLQIDATIRYAEDNWTKPLTQSDLSLDSPYNTYLNPGLPPGPISNPGLASIRAAAHPARVGYLYYITKPGACGKLQFATTLAEQNRHVAAYNRARDAAGGKSPTSCKGG